MTLSITVEDTAIQAQLRQLSQRSDNLIPAMNAIGEALVTLIHDQLSQGQTPWGDSFAPLSDDYLATRPDRASGVILNDTHQPSRVGSVLLPTFMIYPWWAKQHCPAYELFSF